MIKEEYIKPIPKYIEELIYKQDYSNRRTYSGITRFFSYLTKYNKELVQVIVACKNRGKKWYCKQVAIHGVHSDIALIKDIEFYSMCGYVVGWYEQGLTRYRKRYEDGKWYEIDDKYFNPYAPVVNLSYVFKFKEYKYCAIDIARENNVIKYLKLYEKYPALEMLVKFGLQRYASSKTLLNKVSKDKNFRKWLINNRWELSNGFYYISTVLLAYKHNQPFKYIQKFEENKKYFYKSENYKKIKDILNKNEHKQFLDYLQKQNTNLSSYCDYLDACKYLKLDMSIERNKYPKDFKKWHDMRIDQYHTQKALKDEQERKELYEQFGKIAEKYISLQRNLKDDFIMIIAKSPKDLMIEGDKLNHCVGRMNYDQKFIREESLIFFVRDKNNPQTPFVTVEYSLKNHKVLQCYGEKDSRPNENVLNFVNKIWLPYANRKIKKVA